GDRNFLHGQAPKATRPERVLRAAFARDAPAIAVHEIRVPLERLVEAGSLLNRRWPRRIQHRQIDLRTIRRDVAEPGRLVLDPVRLDDRQPDRRTEAHSVSTPASRRASAQADVGSSSLTSTASVRYLGHSTSAPIAAAIASTRAPAVASSYVTSQMLGGPPSRLSRSDALLAS